LFGGYCVVNIIREHNPHALINLLGFVLAGICYWKLNTRVEYNSPLLLNIAIMINAAGHIVLPERVLFWVYPAIATVIIVNQFKTALICSGIFTVFAGTFLFIESLNLIPFDFTYALPNEKFFISYAINCIACLASNLYFRNANEYLKKLYLSGIEELAYWDSLTGLANRHSFEEWAIQKLEEQKNKETLTALLFIDIDNFKYINDTFGHDAGDSVLVHFSQRLVNSIRGVSHETNERESSVCRYAGDEFVILLSDLHNADELCSILDRISNLSINLAEIELNLQEVTFSTGVVISDQNTDTLEKLIKKADQAMYKAKRKGKNQYSFY
jgi:diguanylate cyclase (GGDEF)-like protein